MLVCYRYVRFSTAEVLRDSAGTLHPLIHFGSGIEFSQPAFLAEALAQTAIHPKYLDPYFFQADEADQKPLERTFRHLGRHQRRQKI